MKTSFCRLLSGLMLSLMAVPGFSQMKNESTVRQVQLMTQESAVKQAIKAAKRDHSQAISGQLKPINNSQAALNDLKAFSPTISDVTITPLAASAEKPVSRRVMKTAGGAELWGVVMNASSWAQTEDWYWPYGAYTMTTGGSTTTAMFTDTYSMNFNGGAQFMNGSLYGVNYYEWDGEVYYMTVYKYDTDSWENEYEYYYDGYTLISYATAYDPTTQKVYGFTRSNDGHSVDFSTLDYASHSASRICTNDRAYVALAINAAGEAFAIGSDGNLYAIDKTTGQPTLIGNTGVNPAAALQSATFDLQSNVMYWAAVNSNKTTSLYTVDTTTGQTTKQYDFADNDEVIALYCPMATNQSAPAEAQNAGYDFLAGSLTGHITFDVPTTRKDGETLTGEVTYTISEDGTTLTTGTAQPGEHVEASVTFPEPGEHTLQLTLSNADGESKAVKIYTEWIGKDKPYDPYGVTLTIDDNGLVTLTWEPVTESWHGGYINTEDIKYTVERYDGTIAAEMISETTFTETIEKGEYKPYRYIVYSYSDGVRSEWGAASNAVRWGNPLEVPYTNGFDNLDDWNQMTTVNSGNLRWSWTGLCAESAPDYNGTKDNDNWLVSPPLYLHAGKSYDLTYKAKGGTRVIATAYGHNSDPQTYTLLRERQTLTDGYVTYTDVVRVSEDGVYYFAIHDISTASKDAYLNYRTDVDDFSVTEGVMLTAPAAVAPLTAEADLSGAKRVTLHFMTPKQTFGGEPLSALTKVEVKRNGQLIKTFDTPETGKWLIYVDEDETMLVGDNTYAVVAYNEHGAGAEATVTVTVGDDVPVAPVITSSTDNLDGTVTITWDAPTMGANGGTVNTEALKYNIYTYGYNGWELSGETTATQITIGNVPQTGEQFMSGIEVAAVSSRGEGEPALATYLCGAPYELPFSEKFAGGQTKYSTWASDGFTINEMSSADDEGGCIMYFPSSYGSKGTITTGKISLKNADHPKLYFTYWSFAHMEAFARVIVNRHASQGGEVIREIDLRGNDNGWLKTMVDLSEFKDEEYVTITFEAEVFNPSFAIILDDINVVDCTDHDLALRFDDPAHVNAGTEASFRPHLFNYGEDADDVKLNLYVDGELAATKELGHVASCADCYPEIKWTVPVTSESINVGMEVVCAADENTSNNKTEMVEVKVNKPIINTATDLAAQVNEDGGVALTWNAPQATASITDDFEGYEPFIIDNVGEWTLVDVDAEDVSFIGGSYYSNYGRPAAYMVYNPGYSGINVDALPYMQALSGDQYMASFTSYADHNDDWLISPELSGNEQTVSIHVKSMFEDYDLETYEIYYSLSGKNLEDFQLLKSGEAPLEWTEVEAELPAGAKYFAVRCTSENAGLFMVDDVTYQPMPMEVLGYNIYRDGVKVGHVDGNATSFVDSDVKADGNYEYQVTVCTVYGESMLSDAVAVNMTGIRGLQTGLKVSAENGCVVVRNAQSSVEIFSTSGKLMYQSAAQPIVKAPLKRGTYLVKVGEDVMNIVVR